jgi:hypothetical protein
MEPENSDRVHNSPPIVSVLSHVNTVHNLPFYILSSTSILFFYLSPVLPSGILALVYPTKRLYMFLLWPVRATRPSHFFLFIWLSQQYLVRITNHEAFLWCSFLLSPVISSFQSKIFSSFRYRKSSACVILSIGQTGIPHLYKKAIKITAVLL